MGGNQEASLSWNLGRLRGFSISILNCDNQRVSLPWSLWKVTKRLLYLGTWGFCLQKTNLGLDFKWWVLCCSTILRCVIFLYFFSLTWISPLEGKHWLILVVHWKSFFFLFFEIWNFLWKMIPFVLGHLWKFIFSSFKVELFLKLMQSIFENLWKVLSFFFFFLNSFFISSIFF